MDSYNDYLMGTECFVCGGFKQRGHSLCYDCSDALPSDLRILLLSSSGELHAAAIVECFVYLRFVREQSA